MNNSYIRFISFNEIANEDIFFTSSTVSNFIDSGCFVLEEKKK